MQTQLTECMNSPIFTSYMYVQELGVQTNCPMAKPAQYKDKTI